MTSALPVFMSRAHVELLNQRVAAEQPLLQLCAALKRDLCLLYQMSDGPDDGAVYWRTDFTRAGGVRFALERGEGAADVLISGNYWDVIEAVQCKREMPAPQGEAGDIASIMSILTSNEIRPCAVPVTFPVRGAAT